MTLLLYKTFGSQWALSLYQLTFDGKLESLKCRNRPLYFFNYNQPRLAYVRAINGSVSTLNDLKKKNKQVMNCGLKF